MAALTQLWGVLAARFTTSPKGVATIFFKRRDFTHLVIPVDLFLVIQTARSREVLSQHTVLPADDALGRKRSGNVPVVEVVVVSGEKAPSLDPSQLDRHQRHAGAQA